MPIYEYQCEKCGHVFEVTQSFKDDPVKHCSSNGCKGKVRKLFSPPAIIFKGSGFHVTDYGRGGSGGNGKSRAAGADSAKEADCSSCDKETCAAKSGD